MKIELRRINHNPRLSEETNAFSAEIWIDGERAFEARNQGQGGCDFYRQLGRWTEAEVTRPTVRSALSGASPLSMISRPRLATCLPANSNIAG